MSRKARRLRTIGRHVLFVDCTYKTNIYNVPMLHFVAFTAVNMSFTVGVAFMRQCTSLFYTQALSTFKVMTGVSPVTVVTDQEDALVSTIPNVFPKSMRIGCRWHLAENVASQLRKLKLAPEPLEEITAAFKIVLASRSPGEFESRIRSMEEKYGSKAEYIRQRLEEDSESFVDYALNTVPHFEQLTTSRCEGLHSMIKRRLRHRKS